MKFLLSSLFIGFGFFLACAQNKDSSEWLFVYYMPYDNDLSEQAPAVLKQLETAKKYANVNVVVQLDLADSSGIQRISFVGNTVKVDTLKSERITRKKELKQFLKWTTQQFQFERSALFFLDHGGRQDEIGQDLYPDSTFLNTSDMRKAIGSFNKKTGRLTDLIYLQVCNKASIESLYEFHDLSAYTLASQQLLGAPDYYYEGVFKELQNLPDMDGRILARYILFAENTSMYQSMTCVNNSGFKAVREAFIEYIEAIGQRDDFGFTAAPKSIDYAGDRSWDLRSFLEQINSTDAVELEKRKALLDVIGTEFIMFVRFSPGADSSFSGLSIATLSKQRMYDFRHMKFYRDFKMNELPID